MRNPRTAYIQWMFGAMLTVNAVPLVHAQWTMDPNSLSCTRQSINLGNAPLPACTESKIAFLDQFTYYASALCYQTQMACSANGQQELPQIQLTVNVGLANGPCTNGVNLAFNGGVQAGGQTGSYVWGNLSATSSVAYALLQGSEDCNLIPVYTGTPSGTRLQCT
jgi:hypothetical protein